MSRVGHEVSRRRASTPGTVAVLATVAVALVSTRGPAYLGLPASILFLGYVLCLTLCALWWLLQLMAPSPNRREVMRELRPPVAPPQRGLPPELFTLERLVDGTALDVDWRLPRRLRELAAALLEARTGIWIEPSSPDLAARAGLPGDRLLDLAGRSRWEPLEPPLTGAEILHVIEHLEAI